MSSDNSAYSHPSGKNDRVLIARIGVATGKLLVYVLVVCALSWGALHWFLSYGDIDISRFTPVVERVFNERLSKYQVSVDNVSLTRSSSRYLVLTFDNVTFRSHDDVVVMVVPKVKARLSPLEILFGSIQLLRLELIGVNVAFIHDREGRVRVNMNAGILLNLDANIPTSNQPILFEQQGIVASSLIDEERSETALSDDKNNSNLKHNFALVIKSLRTAFMSDNKTKSIFPYVSEIYIRDATAIFVHERFGKRLVVEHGTFVLSMQGNELRISAQMNCNSGRQQHPDVIRAIAVLRELDDGRVKLVGNISDMWPWAEILPFYSDVSFISLNMPVKTSFELDFLEDGMLHSSMLTISIGKGIASIGGHKKRDLLSIHGGTFHIRYNAETRMVVIDDSSDLLFGSRKAIFSGRIMGRQRNDPDPDSWHYSFVMRDISLQDSIAASGAVSSDIISVRGSIDFIRGSYTLDHGRFTLGPVNLTLAGDIWRDNKDTHIRSTGHLSLLQINDLVAIWPTALLHPVRKWVEDHIFAGDLIDTTLNIEFDWPVQQSIRVVDWFQSDALKVKLGFKNAVFNYLPGSLLLEQGRGTIVLNGPRLTISMDDGYTTIPGGGVLTASSGTFEIPDIRFALPQGNMSLLVAGQVTDLLSFFNRQPFQIFDLWDFDLSSFDGDEAAMLLSLSMPMRSDLLFKDIDIEVSSKLNNVSIQNFWLDRELSNGEFLINVRDKVLFLAGEGRTEGADVRVEWSVPLVSDTQTRVAPNITFSFDNTMYETKFGTVKGPIYMQMIQELQLAEGEKRKFYVRADLSQTTVNCQIINYTKLVGTQAHLLATVTQLESGAYKIQSVEFDADNTMIRGSFSVDAGGLLRGVDFTSFGLSDDDDARLTILRRKPDVLDISLTGQRFDLRKMMHLFMDQRIDTSWMDTDTGTIYLSIQLVKAIGEYGNILNDMKLNAKLKDGIIKSVKLNGRFGNKPLALSLVDLSHDGHGRRLLLTSSDAGSVLGFGGFPKYLEGGSVTLTLDLPGAISSAAQGQMTVNDVVFLDGNISGLSSTTISSGEASRTRFDDMQISFRMKDGMITMGESILHGPSIGIIVQGNIDLVNNKLDLIGTYIPVYPLNNLLARLPIIGEALVGGDGGGILGLTFAVRGSRTDPQVIINPMSLITPGLLRKLFSFQTLGLGVQPQNSTDRDVPLSLSNP